MELIMNDNPYLIFVAQNGTMGMDFNMDNRG